MKGGIPRSSCLAQWRRRVKEKTLVSSSKALTSFSSLWASILRKVDVACNKNGVLENLCIDVGEILDKILYHFMAIRIIFNQHFRNTRDFYITLTLKHERHDNRSVKFNS